MGPGAGGTPGACGRAGHGPEHWETQGEKNPHSAAHYGVYAFKPRLALSFVDEGVDSFTGTSVWLEAHRQNDFLLRPAQEATAVQRIGP